MLKELVLRNRTYRRFDQSARIAPETLRELIDLARLTPSARNAQPLKYLLVSSEGGCETVFPHLAWAGYLKDWPGPREGERPAAYIVMLGDTGLSSSFAMDAGIAAQTILLGAVEKGLGGCIIASVARKELMPALEIPAQFEVLYVLALGKPVENVTIESMGKDGDIKYWRDTNQGHHVPKRSLDELILGER
ncbi:MAG: nitroreductase family protein [Anaerolineaceae bacterium]